MRTLSELLVDINTDLAKQEGTHIPIDHLMSLLNERGFGVMIILLAIPGAIPGCPPPLPSIIALPLCFLCAQIAMAYDQPKLPQFVGGKRIKSSSLSKTIELSLRYIGWVEKLIKPRLEWMTSKRSERILGSIVLIFSMTILIPLPLTNTVPSIAIIIIGIGLISRDGLAIIGGLCVGIGWLIVLFFLSHTLYEAAIAFFS